MKEFVYDGVSTQLIGVWGNYGDYIYSIGPLSIDLAIASATPFESTVVLDQISLRGYLIGGAVSLFIIIAMFATCIAGYILRKRASGEKLIWENLNISGLTSKLGFLNRKKHEKSQDENEDDN